jgi:hypothetical protein
MVIHDFYIIGIPIDPFKAYPPLIVDPDAVLPCLVAAELLQPVCRLNTKIVKRDSIVEYTWLAVADLLDMLQQSSRSQAGEAAGSFLALEGFNHVFQRII